MRPMVIVISPNLALRGLLAAAFRREHIAVFVYEKVVDAISALHEFDFPLVVWDSPTEFPEEGHDLGLLRSHASKIIVIAEKTWARQEPRFGEFVLLKPCQVADIVAAVKRLSISEFGSKYIMGPI